MVNRNFFILDFLKLKRSVLQEKITKMPCRFLNLLRDDTIASGKLSDRIKEDMSKLLQLVKKETATAGDKNFIIPKNFCVSNTFHLELSIVVS